MRYSASGAQVLDLGQLTCLIHFTESARFQLNYRIRMQLKCPWKLGCTFNFDMLVIA
jgi:hypothetical protein